MASLANAAAQAARANWPALRRKRKPGEPLTIWQAEPGVELAFLLWGPCVAAWTHWTGLRTVGCPGLQHDCRWCGVQLPRPKWYVGAWSLQHAKTPLHRPGRCVVELTLAARRGCPSLAYPAETLVGRRLILGRQNKRPNGEAYAKVSEVATGSPPSARAVDPAQALIRTWSTGEDALTVDQIKLLLLLARPISVEVDLKGGSA
jgi:hypothetical protein